MRSVETMQSALKLMEGAEPDSVLYDVYRSAVIKNFELSLETAGQLMRRALRRYYAHARQVDRMTFQQVFREAARHGVLHPSSVSRWLQYRQNRNLTTHDYGELFAEQTLPLMSAFVNDAHTLAAAIDRRKPDAP